MANKNEVKFEQPSDILILINRYIVVIISILIFAILMSGYFFLIKPKMVSNEAQQAYNTKNMADRQASERLLNNLNKLKSEYETIQSERQADLEQLRKIMPTNPQIAELFVLAERLALDNGLLLNSVDISKIDELTTAKVQNNVSVEEDILGESPSPANTAPVTKSKKSGLQTMSLHFSLTRLSEEDLINIFPNQVYPFDPSMDDYDLFKNYIATLESNLRLMDVQSLSLPPLSTAEDDAAPSFNFTVLTYYRE